MLSKMATALHLIKCVEKVLFCKDNMMIIVSDLSSKAKLNLMTFFHEAVQNECCAWPWADQSVSILLFRQKKSSSEAERVSVLLKKTQHNADNGYTYSWYDHVVFFYVKQFCVAWPGFPERTDCTTQWVDPGKIWVK